jgi:ribosome-binding protein aMBF1 (putative translation factor)
MAQRKTQKGRPKRRAPRRVQNRTTASGVELGARIKAARERAGITKTKLAQDTITMVMRYEHGISIAGFDVMDRIADSLGVSLDHLRGKDVAA